MTVTEDDILKKLHADTVGLIFESRKDFESHGFNVQILDSHFVIIAARIMATVLYGYNIKDHAKVMAKFEKEKSNCLDFFENLVT